MPSWGNAISHLQRITCEPTEDLICKNVFFLILAFTWDACRP